MTSTDLLQPSTTENAPPCLQMNVIPQPPSIPSPEISECGWTSPPRTIVNHCPLDDPIPERVPSRSNHTTMDPSHQPMIMESDMKPLRNLTNNICHLIEQLQNDLDRVKDEYMMKFTRDRTSLEHEFNRLMNEERMVIERVDRYISENQPRNATRTSDNRRKYR